jgi:hypothetical protein
MINNLESTTTTETIMDILRKCLQSRDADFMHEFTESYTGSASMIEEYAVKSPKLAYLMSDLTRTALTIIPSHVKDRMLEVAKKQCENEKLVKNVNDVDSVSTTTKPLLDVKWTLCNNEEQLAYNVQNCVSMISSLYHPLKSIMCQEHDIKQISANWILVKSLNISQYSLDKLNARMDKHIDRPQTSIKPYQKIIPFGDKFVDLVYYTTDGFIIHLISVPQIIITMSV